MTKIEPIEKSRDEIRDALREAVKGQIYSNAALITVKQIRDTLMQTTADQRRMVIAGLLGVDQQWGEVRLYQTNGHVTELQKWIQEELGDELKTFVQQCAREAFAEEQGKFRADIRKVIRKTVADNMSGYSMRSSITEVVSNGIRDIAKEAFAEVVKEILPPHEGADRG